MSIKNKEELVDILVAWVREQMSEAHTDKLELDISGGVDSAVMAGIAAKAAGPENVIGVYSSCHSTNASLDNARKVADAFGIRLVEYDFSGAFDLIVAQCKDAFEKMGLPFPAVDDPANRVVFGSLRSTLRAPIGRFTNRAFGGGLRIGTGNRDEDELVRFYQKGGDGEVDNNPIAGLFKSEVWELAEYLSVPQSVIDAVPTPDLWGHGVDHTDEGELFELLGANLTYTRPGGPLGTIEWASRENEKHGVINGECANNALNALATAFGYDDEQIKVIDAVRRMEKMTRHKASPPPLLDRCILKKSGLVE